MAQDFERYLKQDITLVASPMEIRPAANSDDAIIGIRCANTSGTSVNISVYVENTSQSYFIIKDAPIPTGGSLELIDGGAKFVLHDNDKIMAVSDTATSLDTIVSYVDAISA